jgi:hypothetical protein
MCARRPKRKIENSSARLQGYLAVLPAKEMKSQSMGWLTSHSATDISSAVVR